MFVSSNNKRHAVVADSEPPNGNKRRCVKTSSSSQLPSKSDDDNQKEKCTKKLLVRHNSAGCATIVNSFSSPNTLPNTKEKRGKTISTPSSIITPSSKSSDGNEFQQQRQRECVETFPVNVTKPTSQNDFPSQGKNDNCIKKNTRNGTDYFKSEIKNDIVNVANHRGDDNENDDESEVSSLLSSWSDDESSMDLDCKGIERLRKKLIKRKRQLERLCVGRPPAYVQLLATNEEIASERKIAEYKHRHPDEEGKIKAMSNSNSGNNNIEEEKKVSTAHQLLGMIQFEAYHTLPSFCTLLVISFGHATFFGFFECIMRILYYRFFKNILNRSMYHFLGLICGLIHLRLNGSVFYYSTAKNFSLLKMEISNRQKLLFLDTRIWELIRGSLLSSACNMIGYYLISIGISHFYYKIYDTWMMHFEIWWENMWNMAVIQINKEVQQQQLLHQQQTAFQQPTDIITCPLLSDHEIHQPTVTVSPTCAGATEMVQSPIMKWLVNGWCNDLTSEYRDVQLVYHGFWLVASIILGLKVGQKLITYCD